MGIDRIGADTPVDFEENCAGIEGEGKELCFTRGCRERITYREDVRSLGWYAVTSKGRLRQAERAEGRRSRERRSRSEALCRAGRMLGLTGGEGETAEVQEMEGADKIQYEKRRERLLTIRVFSFPGFPLPSSVDS